tara:strand:- start:1885 stop:2787 length:903 start_codon:yes stop_codon:yes gene_type:complete
MSAISDKTITLRQQLSTNNLLKFDNRQKYLMDWRISLTQSFITLITFILTITLGVYLINIFNIPYIFLTFILGLFFHKLSILLHHLCHLNFFPSKKANILVGNLIAWICLTEFDSFRYSHLLHHKYAGQEKDQELSDIIKKGNSSKLKLYLFSNLFGFHLLNNNKHRIKFKRSISYLAIFFIQVLIGSSIVYFSKNNLLGFIWIFSVFTFGIFFSRLRGLLEHFPNKNSAPILTRSHYCNSIETCLFFGLNMNYHAEHHLFPQIPSYHLAEFSRYIKPHLDYNNYSNSAFKTLISLLKNA